MNVVYRDAVENLLVITENKLKVFLCKILAYMTSSVEQ